MKRICAYCKVSMGQKPPLENTSETHGICPACMWREFGVVREETPEASYSVGEAHEPTPKE